MANLNSPPLRPSAAAELRPSWPSPCSYFRGCRHPWRPPEPPSRRRFRLPWRKRAAIVAAGSHCSPSSARPPAAQIASNVQKRSRSTGCRLLRRPCVLSVRGPSVAQLPGHPCPGPGGRRRPLEGKKMNADNVRKSDRLPDRQPQNAS